VLDLQAIAAERGLIEDVNRRLRTIHERHAGKGKFIERLTLRSLDGKTKAWPFGLRMWLRLLIVFASSQTPAASLFSKNLNDINARSAIHPQLGQERAVKRRRAPRQRTTVKMTGGTRPLMIGYM